MGTRRRRSDDADYDSVLDTMTNVVGILIVVVAVTQLNVSTAVGRAQSALIANGQAIDHPPVSDAELEVAKRQRKEVGERLAELESQTGSVGSGGVPNEEVTDDEAPNEDAPDEEVWSDLVGRLREAAAIGEPDELRADIRRLKRSIEKIERETKRLEELIRRTSQNNQRLREQIEALAGRSVKQPPSLQIRLPDPDLARTVGLESHQFVVKRGTVYRLDGSALLARAVTDIKESGVLALGMDRVARYLNGRSYTDSTWRIQFRSEADSTVVGGTDLLFTYELEPRAKGSSLEEILSKNSAFGRRLDGLDRSKHWMFFHVFDDSFEAYLAARAAAEDGGFAVGWQPFGSEESIGGSLLKRGGGSPLRSD